MSVAQSKQIRDRFLTNSRRHFFAGLAPADLSSDNRRSNGQFPCASDTLPRLEKSDD